MVKTTVGKLCQLYKPYFLSAALAPVEYAPDYEIQTEKLDGRPGLMEFGQVYIKRDAFRYENEIRYATSELYAVDYVEDFEEQIRDRIFIKVDPRELLDGIVSDPKAVDWFHEMVYLYCKRAGLNRVCIEKSQLYTLDPFRE